MPQAGSETWVSNATRRHSARMTSAMTLTAAILMSNEKHPSAGHRGRRRDGAARDGDVGARRSRAADRSGGDIVSDPIDGWPRSQWRGSKTAWEEARRRGRFGGHHSPARHRQYPLCTCGRSSREGQRRGLMHLGHC